MRWLILISALLASFPHTLYGQDKLKDIPLTKLGDDYRLIGKIGVPLGEVVTVQGIVVEGPFKGYEGGPNLRVQRINGRATQQDIQICLGAYFNGFGEKSTHGIELPKLEFGKTYEFEGYETGGFIGKPAEAYKRAGAIIQTAGFYFRHELEVYKGKKIEPLVWSPADFVNRVALLEGRATSRDGKAYLEGVGWRLLVDSKAPWLQAVEGKTAESLGAVKNFEGGYRLENGVTGLVKLEDQLGRQVSLRGRAWSVNDRWTFEYRGTEMYVEDIEKLPGWNRELWGKSIQITGELDTVELPERIYNPGQTPRLKKFFIVRKAAWKRLDALLSPERVEPPNE